MILNNHAWDWTGLFSFLQALAYRCFQAPGLTNSGGTTTQPKTVNAVNYCAQLSAGQVAPVLASKAATDPLPAFPSTFTNTTATQSTRVRIEINKSGTVTYVQGPVAATLGLASMPRRTQGLATLGWIEITNVAGGFTFGTTALSVAGVTFFDGDPDLGGIEGVPPNDRGIDTTILRGP